jgi:copper chaperone CopZ
MRTLLILSVLLATFAGAARAETIIATVDGMVCAFCATGIEKTFKAQPGVESVEVDLGSKLVTIHTAPKQTLADKTVKKLITDAGYSVVDIRREK